jgi:FKBP-type peptidyl-prolyl cis-trans isomerase FklB
MLKNRGWLIVLIILMISVAVYGESNEETTESPLVTEEDKLSYAIGLNLAGAIKMQGIDVDVDLVMKGFADGISDKEPLLTNDEIRQVFNAMQEKMRAKQVEQLQKLSEKNRVDGEAFLADNKDKEGVVTLPSGLQYKELQTGDGPSPKDSDIVTVHYRGTLIDGTEFDSSYKRGEPATFPLNGVIRGWTEAVQLMKVGAKWQLFIPSDLAYGANGAGQVIGPNAVLIFEVELLGIRVSDEEKN